MNNTRQLFRRLNRYLFSLSVLLIMLALPLTASSDDVTEGKQVYEKYCIGCHGVDGDGNGIVATDLLIQPRDFTKGVFKFKSTPTGSLPTDDDLMKTITDGLPTSSMPRFRLVPEVEKKQVIAYIKTFSDRWETEKPEGRYPEVQVPDFVGTKESILRGEELFVRDCERCHGSKEKVPDVWYCLKWVEIDEENAECHDLIRPANFTHGVIKRGPLVEDIYMSITTGAEGTPMISYDLLHDEEDTWHLTSYILEMMGKVRR